VEAQNALMEAIVRRGGVSMITTSKSRASRGSESFRASEKRGSFSRSPRMNAANSISSTLASANDVRTKLKSEKGGMAIAVI